MDTTISVDTKVNTSVPFSVHLADVEIGETIDALKRKFNFFEDSTTFYTVEHTDTLPSVECLTKHTKISNPAKYPAKYKTEPVSKDIAIIAMFKAVKELEKAYKYWKDRSECMERLKKFDPEKYARLHENPWN